MTTSVGLSCGCTVPRWYGRPMQWLLTNRYYRLFDLLHPEWFVRRHTKRG